MSAKHVSELNAAGTLTGSEVILVEQSGESVQTTLADIAKASITAGISQTATYTYNGNDRVVINPNGDNNPPTTVKLSDVFGNVSTIADEAIDTAFEEASAATGLQPADIVLIYQSNGQTLVRKKTELSKIFKIGAVNATDTTAVESTDSIILKTGTGANIDVKKISIANISDDILDTAIGGMSDANTTVATDKVIIVTNDGTKLSTTADIVNAILSNGDTISDSANFTTAKDKIVLSDGSNVTSSMIVEKGIGSEGTDSSVTSNTTLITNENKTVTVGNAITTGINAITEFDAQNDTAILSTDKIVVITSGGMKRVPFNNISVISSSGSGGAATSCNCSFRGKNLGNVTAGTIDTFITEHGINTGEFTDLYVGDYFTASYNGAETVFRVAGMNSFLYTGDKDPNTNSTNGLASNHIVVVPDYQLQTAAMNSSDSTTGGYLGSNMFKSVIGGSGVTSGINKNLYTIFGSHLIKYRELLSNAINTSSKCTGYGGYSGASGGWEWTDVYANLLSGVHLWGCSPAASSFYDFGIVTGQLPLFRFEPKYIINRKSSDGTRNWYWLRNVVSSSGFAGCSYCGRAGSSGASGTAGGVRPLFLLG